MELKRAKEVLAFFDELSSTRLLYASAYGDSYIYADSTQRVDVVVLHGEFYPNQLEAIATWMRDPEGVVKA